MSAILYCAMNKLGKIDQMGTMVTSLNYVLTNNHQTKYYISIIGSVVLNPKFQPNTDGL